MKNLFTTSMAQLVRAPASGALGSLFTSGPDHIHTKDFNYEIIYLWYEISKLLEEKLNSSLHFIKKGAALKKLIDLNAL